MNLKEKLQDALKRKYGIENEQDLAKAIEELPEPDLGIFTSPLKKEDIA